MDDQLSVLQPINRPEILQPHTQGAEGMPRRPFTQEDIVAMQEAGILHPDERFELIGGEIVPMHAKYNRHEIWKQSLMSRWVRALPEDLSLYIESTLWLETGELLEPDVSIYPANILPQDRRGCDARIIIEIADSSLHRDLVRKKPIYARNLVPEYWVLDAQNRRAHIFAEPSEEGVWQVQKDVGDNATLAPRFMPGLALKLTDLDF